MLTCMTCSSKQRTEDGGGGAAARGSDTPSTKETVKSLTTQIKDIALKFSGVYKQCTGFKKGQRPYADLDAISGVPYPFMAGSASSTPAWDFSSSHHQKPDSISTRRVVSASDVVALEDEDAEPKEWMAQVEPGVHITFMSLPSGGNDLKRIRFSREMFDKRQAQQWWGENYDRIMELYNVQRFNRQSLNTPPPRSGDERDSTGSNPWEQGEFPNASCMDTTTRSSVSMSNASDMESEWVEQDEPGVYITIRQLAHGTRELRRVRFSRDKFGEMNAKLWWEENRERIQEQYL